MIRRDFPSDRDAAIVELGCGHGAIIYLLHKEGYRNVLGVDVSAEQVGAAKRLGITGVREGEIMATLIDMPSASCDVIVTFDVIEHFDKDELIPLVDEVHRVLKRGGRWIIHAPNAEAPFGAVMRHWDFTHELAFTRMSLAQLLKSSGFDEVRCYEDRPIPHGIKSAVRAFLWRIIRMLLLGYLAVETGVIDTDAIFSQNLLAVAVR